MTVLRRFMLFMVAATLLVPATGAQAPAKAGGIPRPNVLIIFTDDQRPDTMMVMPQVQRWFEQLGTRYPNTYVGTPLCCPSRANIMTGRYAHNTGVVDNTTHHNMDQSTTLQALLRHAGYKTAIVGKYFNGWPLRRDPQHFDRWAIFRSGYLGTKWGVDGKLRRIDRYSTDYITAQSVRLMKSFDKVKDSQPWLMYVTPSAPHEPFTPASRHASAPVPPWDPPPSFREEDKSDKPPAVRNVNADEAGVTRIRDGQLRTLMAVDELVGHLMTALREQRELKRTLVFFTSDNGFFWGEHGLIDKRMPYTEAIGVPFFARWPGHIAPGARDQRQVSLVDVAPTVLAATDTPPHPTLPPDGRSLLDPWDREDIYTEYFPDRGAGNIGSWASIRTRTIQYVEYYAADGASVDFREYYDLQEDPYQLRNLLGDGNPANDPPPTELQELSLRLSGYRTCQGTSGVNPCP